MGRKIAGDRNEDVAALATLAPRGELADSRLQHLVGVEARIFPQYSMRKRRNQGLRRVAEREVPCHQPCCEINLSLPVEGVKQGSADYIGGQVVELVAALAWDSGRGRIEVPRMVEGHRSVQYATRDHRVTVSVGGSDPLEDLVNRVGVGEVCRAGPIHVAA